ncbi:MAG: hypothetical protein FWD48_03585 [Oscillospiraceae bacterium]|nr:hypothetical protein [Oscillospiraceae bacterium]
MKKIAKTTLAVFCVILMLSALILDTKTMTDEIVSAVETCLYTIIPALFGFMVVSSYLIKSGLYRIIFKPLYFILRRVIRLSEEEFGIFLLSLFGGYPVGAKLIADNKITRDILPFCYCPSPGFVIFIVGIGLFSSPQVGIAVYLSNVLACVLLAIVLSFKNKKVTGGQSRPPLLLNVITPSVLSASSALFPVCAVVTAFGLIKGTLRFIGVENAFVFAVLEISGVANLTPNPALLPLIAALFSTGGLCIITQIPALINKKIPLKGFLIWRIPAAILSALICKLFMPLLDFTAYVAASTTESAVAVTQANSPIASVSLLMMAMILVKTAEDKSKQNTCD